MRFAGRMESFLFLFLIPWSHSFCCWFVSSRVGICKLGNWFFPILILFHLVHLPSILSIDLLPRFLHNTQLMARKQRNTIDQEREEEKKNNAGT